MDTPINWLEKATLRRNFILVTPTVGRRIKYDYFDLRSSTTSVCAAIFYLQCTNNNKIPSEREKRGQGCCCGFMPIPYLVQVAFCALSEIAFRYLTLAHINTTIFVSVGMPLASTGFLWIVNFVWSLEGFLLFINCRLDGNNLRSFRESRATSLAMWICICAVQA